MKRIIAIFLLIGVGVWFLGRSVQEPQRMEVVSQVKFAKPSMKTVSDVQFDSESGEIRIKGKLY